LLFVALLPLIAACSSTTQPVAATTEAGRIAQSMEERGVDLANPRPVTGGQTSERVVETYGFDIPGIRIGEDKPAGTIRIYRGEKEAEAERRLYAMLGKPGPETKLDYVTVEGTRGLILDHRLPNDVAQRYIDAFSSSP
jgi:hypothetical protein